MTQVTMRPINERPTGTRQPLVLASGSRYRAAVLGEAGFEVLIEAPEVDERALDELLDPTEPEEHALRLALAKACAVADRIPDALVIAADQLGILEGPDGPVFLHKQPTFETAVDQLMRMSGTKHRLVNGVVVLDTRTGEHRDGVDVMLVTMRSFGAEEASAYVERFEPYDSAGSYRMEDQEQMEPSERLITKVEGEDPSGVLGMPIPLLRRLLTSIDPRI